jgi:hypothetical protein
MGTNCIRLVASAVLIMVTTMAISKADTPKDDVASAAAITAALAKLPRKQETLKLPVRIVDADGKPVANAKVTPWALRCSQGHGTWGKDDKRAGLDPQDYRTDENGTATVLYPRYRDLPEQISTIGVSLFVDHPEFAYANDLHIDVPLTSKDPYEIKLKPGVPVKVRPTIDGKAASLENLYAIWSDGRSWRSDVSLQKTAEGTLKIPAMPPGKNSLLLVTLEGERATHLSKIVDFELTNGEPKSLDVELQPSLQIRGKLSDNVPRPVRNGRLKTETLSPDPKISHRVSWFSWSPINEDGTFTIDGWPAGEPIQIIALCDGFHATSGKAPAVVENPRDPATDPFTRPQVFEPDSNSTIELAMTPLVQCVATAVDEADQPVAGIKVVSCPNVGWWNDGSQIYCDPLVRSERILRERDYRKAVESDYPEPFQATTDAEGKATLELPAGHERLAVMSDVYELPVFLGGRDVRVNLVEGQTTETVLRLQPAGTEKLGEWDKLAGVVFGCSTREGRQICALPGVRKKMDEFTERFRQAKNQRDPKLLSEAYAAVADAFKSVGDADEAAKWQKKSDEQAALAKAAKPK